MMPSRRALVVLAGILSCGVLIRPSASGNRCQAAEPANAPKLEVLGDDWGGAGKEDIAAVLRSAAAEFARYQPERKEDQIRVSYSAEGPIVLYARGPSGEYQVRLNVQGRYWAQFAYQFAHEHCHIACNYKEGVKPHQWFEESLCELASLFVMRKMAETWKHDPPYPNWKSFAPALQDYVDRRIAEAKTPPDRDLAAWVKANAESLRSSGTNRDKNLVAAVLLLSEFEKEPEHWAAVGYLNSKPQHAKQSFEEHLANWRESAPERHRPFIERIARRLGTELPPRSP